LPGEPLWSLGPDEPSAWQMSCSHIVRSILAVLVDLCRSLWINYELIKTVVNSPLFGAHEVFMAMLNSSFSAH